MMHFLFNSHAAFSPEVCRAGKTVLLSIAYDHESNSYDISPSDSIILSRGDVGLLVTQKSGTKFGLSISRVPRELALRVFEVYS